MHASNGYTLKCNVTTVSQVNTRSRDYHSIAPEFFTANGPADDRFCGGDTEKSSSSKSLKSRGGAHTGGATDLLLRRGDDDDFDTGVYGCGCCCCALPPLTMDSRRPLWESRDGVDAERRPLEREKEEEDVVIAVSSVLGNDRSCLLYTSPSPRDS